MTAPRLPLLDVLRGAALIGMIVYHVGYDLAEYWAFPFGVQHGAWRALARITAVTFLLVSGMVVCVSEERMRTAPKRIRMQKRARRAVIIGMAAATVSLVTYAVEPVSYVRFGILHLLAVSRLLLPLTHRAGTWNIALGTAVIAFGAAGPWHADTSAFLMFGAYPTGFSSVDYFPLFPWYGITLIGMGLMHVPHVSRFCAQHPHRHMRPLAWAGRHTLAVYLLHQPIILGMLTVLLGTP